jgi:hypothetical protein
VHGHFNLIDAVMAGLMEARHQVIDGAIFSIKNGVDSGHLTGEVIFVGEGAGGGQRVGSKVTWMGVSARAM